MRWIKPNLRNSLHAIFSWSPAPPPPSPDEQDAPLFTIDDIRAKMVSLLPESDDERVAIVRRRLRYADSIESLWFMRGELMAVLAKDHGEAAAFETLSGVSDMFDDLLPSGLRSRPSPLGKS